MTSSVSICSNALLALGGHPINDLSEATEHARLCANIYPTVRNNLLRAHPWNCAVKRVVLSPTTATPIFGFSQQFTLPSDLLRLLSVGEVADDIDYQLEGNRLLANINMLKVRYIFRNEDESTWDAALIQVAEAMMQARLAYAVTGSTSLRDSLTQEANYLLRQAKSIDGQEQPSEILDGFPTFESRF
ncbi:hypothetical protein HGT73_05350 [Rosenbergiella australiborealis]|uniref:Uncharacterized protein n=1 Tax=Rosenbergiella australiborealis TaxID=1544696 RepID=A0ABS5T4Y9_9GAMM|nr:hypothetical protein [Rosenbergiella australiborealis]MBT0726813.1 hypothetical protein [Rosenbergiella australiborealis]